MARKKDEALAKVRKQEILDAAAKCFVRHGIHQASMRQICTEANLSAGAVYNYFDGKDAIIEAMAEAEQREISELAEYLDKSKNCYKAIIQAVKWIIEETTTSEAQLAIELLAEAQRNPDVKQYVVASDQAIKKVFFRTIERGQEQKQITKKQSAEVLATLIIATFEGLLGRIEVEENANRKNMAKLANSMLATILAP